MLFHNLDIINGITNVNGGMVGQMFGGRIEIDGVATTATSFFFPIIVINSSSIVIIIILCSSSGSSGNVVVSFLHRFFGQLCH